jgi:isopentenyl diphosphate isomerase/L-lactate dehydrogenase-like FMN-dependent dehydrogenase
MEKEKLTISEIYARGKESLSKYPYLPSPYVDMLGLDISFDASVRANRKYLNSLFFVPKFFDPVPVETGLTLWGIKLRSPVFCTAIGGLTRLSKDAFPEIAKGLKNAGSLMMIGIASSMELRTCIDTGVPVIKIVKPYQKTELIYESLREAESSGCLAVGMDIDHFYGRLRGDRLYDTKAFSPQKTDELKQLVHQTKLPFIIKGVLSVSDAEKALAIGASGIIVSNHGSGSVDFSVPSMIALPNIVERVGDKITVLIDTGFRTGNDVLKALALGAKAVGLATPIMLAWGADGSRGVESLITQITLELQRTMAATGCPDLAAVNKEIIVEVLLTRV